MANLVLKLRSNKIRVICIPAFSVFIAEGKLFVTSLENLPLIADADNIQDEFEKYWQEQKLLALAKLCEKEQLDKEQFKALTDAYIFSGQDPIRDEVLKCLGNRPSILQARAIGERIIFKMNEYIEIFERGMVA